MTGYHFKKTIIRTVLDLGDIYRWVLDATQCSARHDVLIECHTERYERAFVTPSVP